VVFVARGPRVSARDCIRVERDAEDPSSAFGTFSPPWRGEG
jgi:hypothetical protein